MESATKLLVMGAVSLAMKKMGWLMALAVKLTKMACTKETGNRGLSTAKASKSLLMALSRRGCFWSGSSLLPQTSMKTFLSDFNNQFLNNLNFKLDVCPCRTRKIKKGRTQSKRTKNDRHKGQAHRGQARFEQSDPFHLRYQSKSQIIYLVQTHMEKQHLANQKQMGASLPIVNVGTFSNQPSGYSSTNFTKNASDVNKELLMKASEGMMGLSYLLQEIHGEQNVNPNLHKAALESLS